MDTSVAGEVTVQDDDDGGQPRKRMRLDNSIEQNVGILHFLSNHLGFDGLVKYRYSDFLVNEIRCSGTVVHLTDLNIPKTNNNSNVKTDDDVVNLIENNLIEKLKSMSELKLTDSIFIPVAKLTKEERTTIHQYIRSIDMNLKSETVNSSEKEPLIKVTYENIDRQNRTRRQDNWPDKSKPYLKFVLYKENRDTMDAIQHIAKFLNISTSLFQYAGVKDKRGKTCQEITIHRVVPERFKNISSKLPSIKVGNFKFCDEQLQLGLLKGNRFEVFIRNIKNSSNIDIINCVEKWIENGFINYFGLQRFGSRMLQTFTIGKYLIRRDWSLAIDSILAYDESIKPEWLRQILDVWNKTHDIETILNGHHGRRSIEIDLLRGIQNNDRTNLVGALSFVPRNTRLLYLHSYQSKIWNQIVSRRFSTYNNQILDGDLYRMNDDNNNIKIVDETNRNQVKLEQLVLPLPGYDVIYPKNVISTWYKDLLLEDGIDINQFKHQVKDYSLSGDYRHFIVKPEDVQYKLINYNNIDDDILRSDYDRLTSVDSPITDNNGQFSGLKISFSLPKSCYATMALRELLHRNESQLQNEHQDKETIVESEFIVESSI